MELSTMEYFTIWFGLTEAFGAMLLVLVTVWVGSYRGGFAWQSNPKIQFNWHPLLMTLSMVFLYANAMLLYRAFRNSRKRKLKIAHAVVNILAFIFAVIGLQAAFDSHNLASPPIPNMYSLHSWLGILSVFFFACQWVAGLITFLYPTLSGPLRAKYYPIHIFFGISAFVCAAATALLGLTEKAIFSVAKFSSEGILINVIGIGIIVFTSLVVHLVSEPKYKRQPLPEDEMLLTSNERKKLRQKLEVICPLDPTLSTRFKDSNLSSQNFYCNREDFKSCELLLEYPGVEDETLKTKIDHLLIRNNSFICYAA